MTCIHDRAVPAMIQNLLCIILIHPTSRIMDATRWWIHDAIIVVLCLACFVFV
jgi:hypothetical protein